MLRLIEIPGKRNRDETVGAVEGPLITAISAYSATVDCC